MVLAYKIRQGSGEVRETTVLPWVLLGEEEEQHGPTQLQKQLNSILG